MNNMKSNVCKKANAFIAQGHTRSAAFVKAWALVKADAITEKMDWIEGADRMSSVQLNQYRELGAKRTALWNKADSIKTAAEIEAHEQEQAAAAARWQEE